jgi:hypothetical protein
MISVGAAGAPAVLVELLFGAGIAKFAMNFCSLDTNKNTNKTDGCRE